MSKSNEEEEDSLPPNQNTKPSSSSQRPPLLTKSKTLTELRAAAAAAAAGGGPGGAETNPLFSTVRRIKTLATSASYFSDRDYVYPSFLGAYPNRTRVNHVKPRSANPDRPTVDGDVKSAASPENSSRDSDSETGKLLVSSASQASLVSQLGARRIRGFNHSLILYLLSFTCILSVPYAAYLQNRVAKLQEEKSNLCHLCVDNHIFNGSTPHFGNANVSTVALYTVVFTIFMPFMFYKYLDRLPPIKRLSKSTKINKEEVPLKKRVAYMVDVCFSIYPYAKLLALFFATIFLIGFGGLALYAVSESSFTEALWLAWTFVADSGNHADRVGTGPRIVSVSISSGGMLIFAMMLGLISDAISEKMDSLRKGKSEVIERDHILILGWSDKLGSLLKQLAIANKSIGGGVIVVLAERDKEEMEIDIGKLEFDFMGTSVICRSGSPLILADLKKVSVSKARAIIVLASHENADQSDARALRVVLSLTGVKEGLRGHVVVEMSDIDNEPLVKLVGGDLIETVVAHDVIGRLMIKCALQPGLAQIWEDILGFENAEFYIKRWPELDGLRFKDVLISFPDAVPCGIKVAAEGGKIDINPDDDYELKEGDEVLVIAEDDDTYAPDHLPEVRKGLFPKIADPPKYPEKILFCGWRRDIDDMIMVLEAFLAPGSQLWMFNEVPEKEREKKLTDGGLDVSTLENIKLVHREGNAVIRRHLDSLPLETFDSILILADESLEDSVVQADSRSLATLLLIRDIQSKRLPHKDTKSTNLRLSGFCHSSWIREMQQASDKSIIISEILDSRTRNLVSVSRISDYVLSNELVSMALAMVAEDKQINRVLEELFAEEVYALMSFLSLVLPAASIYFNSFREVYEAWVIYNFLSLCLGWVGGPGAVVLSLSGRVLKPSWYLMTCCLPPIPLDGRFIRRCKQGCLQFVILKPILVAVTLILYAKGKYEDGNFSPNQSYLYLTIIYTISYTMALYALALFYLACKDLLQPFNPVPKFILIKSVVFLTYWQGVLVFLAAKSGFIKDAEEAAEFQNFIICVEMLIAAVGHLYAFPYKEYAGANIGVSRGLTGSLAHALKLNDFYHDTVHQFAPTYHDYVLYNHNEGDEGTRKYRSRTFVPTGPEMESVRRNKHMFGNKLDDIQLSSLSSSSSSTPKNPDTVTDSTQSDVMKSSLLVDTSNTFSEPYDMSLIELDVSNYPSKVPAVNETGTR